MPIHISVRKFLVLFFALLSIFISFSFVNLIEISLAAELQSSNFKIEGDSLKPVAADGTSTNYKVKGESDPLGSSSSTSNFLQRIGFLPRILANTPFAPTLENPSQYYDKLLVTIDPSGNPSDATFVIAVTSTTDWSSYDYLQADGTLGSTPVYQTYSQWGGASGTLILGLHPDTTYMARVRATRGDFTETNFGPESSAATTSVPFITVQISDLSLDFPTLSTSGISQTPLLTVTVNTNAASGYDLKINDEGNGSDGGLNHETNADFIVSEAETLTTGQEGYGLQANSSTATISSQYDYMGTDQVGELFLTSTPVATNTEPVTDETTMIRLKATISSYTVAGKYEDILYFTIAPHL